MSATNRTRTRRVVAEGFALDCAARRANRAPAKHLEIDPAETQLLQLWTFKDGSQIEAEMIDDARTKQLGLAVKQLLKSITIEIADRVVADLVENMSSDSVFRGDGGG